ncbi:DUF982 domain-containing protein [Rhizobium helianthi]|uniref:DUF982 domain-containing protein n=1 Tax=Rhizobium helianthi TaxID=1132695 RepID=A0ABW4LYS7_9HYPH
MNKEWTKGVSLALDGPGQFRTIKTLQEASWALIDDWPLEEGEELDKALLIFEAALKGKKSPEAARMAFIAAAHEAGIEIRE